MLYNPDPNLDPNRMPSHTSDLTTLFFRGIPPHTNANTLYKVRSA